MALYEYLCWTVQIQSKCAPACGCSAARAASMRDQATCTTHPLCAHSAVSHSVAEGSCLSALQMSAPVQTSVARLCLFPCLQSEKACCVNAMMFVKAEWKEEEEEAV